MKQGSANDKKAKLKKPFLLLPLAAIMTIFITLTSLLIGLLTWHFTSIGGETSALAFAGQLQEEMLAHATTDINSHIENAERLSLTQQYNWKKGIFDPADKPKAMRALFPQLLLNQEKVITQSFTTFTGELWGYYTYFVNNGSASVRKYSQWVQYGTNYTEYDIDKDLNILGINYQDDNSNNSEGDWVTMVNRTDPKDIAWSGAYVWQDIVWLTNSVPMLDTQNAAIGVCSTDMDLMFLNSLLQKRAASVKQVAILYVIEANTELVIGASKQDIDMMFTDPVTLAKLRPFTTTELGLNPGTSELMQLNEALARTKLKYKNVNSPMNFIIKNNNKEYMVALQPIQWRSIHWVVVQLLERDEVYKPIKSASVSSLTALAIVIVISLICGVLFAWTIGRSLRKIVLDMAKLERFEFTAVYSGEGNSIKSSLIKEVFGIQEAFHRMVISFATSLGNARKLTTQSSEVQSATGPRLTVTRR